MGLFSRKKDGKSKKKGANGDAYDQQPVKPQWSDAWARTSVEPEEVHELVKRCTEEIKTRGMSSISSSFAATQRLRAPFALGDSAPCPAYAIATAAATHSCGLSNMNCMMCTNCLCDQPWTILSCCCLSDRLLTPALSALSYATSSTIMRCAERHWRRSCG